MNDDILKVLVDHVAAASGYGGLDMGTMYGKFAFDVAQRAVLAERETCANLVAPKTPRPCGCESCDCGNKDDAQRVAEWDAENLAATAIRLRSNAMYTAKPAT